MPFERRILHHGPEPEGTPIVLSPKAVGRCWFELHRQGGCGAGEVILSSTFDLRNQIEIGDWISFESEPGERWYLGRVEERHAESPAQVRLRLEGMGIELNEVFPGGFGLQADGRRPHRYAATDLFPYDPDRDEETYDLAASADEVVKLLMEQYVTGNSRIAYLPERVETPSEPAPVTSLKVRGEESVRSLLKELALRARSASWGVDADGAFFFLRPRTALLATFREGRDLTTLREVRDREYLFNRVLLTGDYVYDRREGSDDIARRSYRWRGNFVEPTSRAEHGDRRIRIWLPWIRTQADSLVFAREFFRIYSRPSSRFFIETAATMTLPLPWQGRVRIENRSGQPLITARVETVRVLFDHAPRLRMELGPEDPRNLWPEPPHDERWELPDQTQSAGGDVSIPDPSDDDDGGGSSDSTGFPLPSFEPSSLGSLDSPGSSGSLGSTGSLGSEGTSWSSFGDMEQSDWSDWVSDDASDSLPSWGGSPGSDGEPISGTAGSLEESPESDSFMGSDDSSSPASDDDKETQPASEVEPSSEFTTSSRDSWSQSDEDSGEAPHSSAAQGSTTDGSSWASNDDSEFSGGDSDLASAEGTSTNEEASDDSRAESGMSEEQSSGGEGTASELGSSFAPQSTPSDDGPGTLTSWEDHEWTSSDTPWIPPYGSSYATESTGTWSV